ncbi:MULTISPECIES: baseplate J/gp47 family protein [unclassified Sedimentibacter]|uniref:baseplate J/gp47 family protein n=1 Tax=unclassified Sedimentibacter TaxID=2649220 RepID=UPI0027DFDAEF|nr:baseplate J/gp47 family protein [Sedimentibacter sp. MB35-C1]WMJ78513.1 baseplate J/gp47 family protein [Sedimentibacter sp. MB35-C1]
MFENMTYEYILGDMLGKVTSDVDKREGSVIYDALAPCAYQIAQTYFYLNNFIDLVSGDTAVGKYLDRVVADYGISRKSASYAVRQVETTGEVTVGTRWGLEDTTYVITESVSTNIYKARCEQLGTVGNQYTGTLENIDNVAGITASLTGIIASGSDEETDENLRERFYAQIQSPSTSGNAYNYKMWALEVPGVGDAKIFPLWNGPGTVKVLVIDGDMCIDTSLPSKVKSHIESVRPIGASVTVSNPSVLTIDVAANVVLDRTKTMNDVQSAFDSSLAEYLKDTAFKIYNISYAKIGSILLSTEGVRDYDSLLVNSGVTNIELDDEEVPVAGAVTLTEVM